ncbi:MAG: glycosyltransferase family 9 protein [Ignavibacteria bacterium]|nr:glycosyltransferase family 9 protein [Ignavibacteria bacterium]MCC7158386.1 glycosyltransferase family 9 protein [Ignavibacteria bacterium]
MKEQYLVKYTDKILFIAEGQLGDNLLLGPALRAFKQKYPKSSVTVLIMHRRKYIKEAGPPGDKFSLIYESNYTGTSEVYRNHPYVDKVIELNREKVKELRGAKRLRAEWDCISYIRKFKFSAVVCTFPSERFTTLAFLSGIKMRIGDSNQKLSYLLNTKPEKCNKDLNVLDYYCCLLEPLGVRSTSNETFFNISENAERFADSFFKENGIAESKKAIAIHPGASLRSKQMPPKFFAELMNMLINEDRYDVFLCFSEFDSDYIDILRKYLNKPVPEAQTPVPELAALLKKSSMAIMPDSGPRHLAAAVGTKTIALIQDFAEKRWEVYRDESRHVVIMSHNICDTCKKDGKCYGYPPDGEKYGSMCMSSIQPADVFSRVESLLNNKYFSEMNENK